MSVLVPQHDKLLTLAAGCFQWLALCFCSSWKASNIPTVFSWDDSISPEGFLPSILLLVVIIVAVVVVVIVTVVLVAVVIGGSSIIKLSFVFIGSLHRIILGYLIH
ncbi:hypothetical protein Tco_0729305 [Tanacetum coccineum]|uniref:Uncharacterized protein n=1 Tax=Tanacetum coccineum TaxID=301880 RepID=A0ABQ4YNI5_9ASTR